MATFTIEQSGGLPVENNFSGSWNDGSGVEVQFTVFWEVKGSDQNYRASEAVDFVGINFGASYDPFPAALCRSIDANKINNITTVTAVFRTGVTTDPNPLDQPTVWSGSFDYVDVDIDFDVDDEAILNTAGQPYDPAVKRTEARPVARATKNYATFDFSAICAYANMVNSDTFEGCNPGTLIVRPTWSQKYDANIGTYYTFDFEFVFNPLGWSPIYVVSMGMMEKDGSGQLVPILKDNCPITEPCKLDDDGHVTDTAYFQEFNIMGSIAFSGLGL